MRNKSSFPTGENKMKTHECKQCGKCCQNLEPSVPGAPGGLLLTPDEAMVFVKHNPNHVIQTIGYTMPGNDTMLILYYGMIAQKCPMYDNGCTIYEDRPLVCRRYPLGNNIHESNQKCPVVVDGGVLFEDDALDAMFDLEERSTTIMASVPKGSILYIFNIENNEWDIVGVK